MPVEQPLGDLLEALIDYRGKTPPKSTSGIPLITAKVIKGGVINEDRLEYVSEETYSSWMRRGFPKLGDILITTEAPLGEVAQLRTDSRVALAQRVILLRADPEKVSTQFLFHFLRSPLAQARLRQRSSGTTVAGIRQPELRAVLVPSPPLCDQVKIGDMLDTFDSLIENDHRQVALLKEIVQKTYDEWFVRFRWPGSKGQKSIETLLGPIPEGWNVDDVGSVCSYLNRGITPKYSEDGPYLVINQKCIRNGQLSLRSARRQSKLVPSQKQIRFGDVLINSTGVGTLGRIAQVYQDLGSATVDSHVTIARSRPDLGLDWFGLSLLALQDILEGRGVGTTGQTELSRDSISRELLVVPPPDLQREFGDLVGNLRRLSGELAARAGVVTSMRDRVLPRLVTGQIDVASLDFDSLVQEAAGESG